MHCGRSLDGGLSKLEAVALAKELCEAAVSSLGSPCRARLLFCPLCTQSFGYSYGLESHLLSVHHDELLADRRPKVDLRDTSFSRETVNCGSFRICRMHTEIRYKAGPRLRDLTSWPPLVAGASSRNLGPTL